MSWRSATVAYATLLAAAGWDRMIPTVDTEFKYRDGLMQNDAEIRC